MTKLHRHLTTTLAIAIALAALPGCTAASAQRSGAEIISKLKRSRLSLAKGSEECRSFAADFSTLGALVKEYDKLANGERIATCDPKPENPGVLSCRAQFSNDVPPERSVEEFMLLLEFDLKGRRVENLKCFLAG